MIRLLPLLLIFGCNAPNEPASNDLGQYRFVAPMDIEPVYTWGDDMATEYADSLQEVRIQDSTEDSEFSVWADSMKRAEKIEDCENPFAGN